MTASLLRPVATGGVASPALERRVAALERQGSYSPIDNPASVFANPNLPTAREALDYMTAQGFALHDTFGYQRPSDGGYMAWKVIRYTGQGLTVLQTHTGLDQLVIAKNSRLWVYATEAELLADPDLEDGMLATSLSPPRWLERTGSSWSDRTKEQVMPRVRDAMGAPALTAVEAHLRTPGRRIDYISGLGDLVRSA